MTVALDSGPPPPPPLLRAVAHATKPICQLLKCINIASSVHVQPCENGIWLKTNSSRVVQGAVFLDKGLFASYSVNLPPANEDGRPAGDNFQVPFTPLLEILQIFGTLELVNRAQKAENDSYRSNIRNYKPDVFSCQALGIAGTCCITIAEPGSTFDVVIEEAGVKTTASLATYLPEEPDIIPIDSTDSLRIVLPARLLLGVMNQLNPAAPEKLVIRASRNSPSVVFYGRGFVASSTVRLPRKDGGPVQTLSMPQGRWAHTYRFDLFRGAIEAMRIADKVSLRGDEQGVLSWHFRVASAGRVGDTNYVRYTFVPFAEGIEEDSGSDEDETDEECVEAPRAEEVPELEVEEVEDWEDYGDREL